MRKAFIFTADALVAVLLTTVVIGAILYQLSVPPAPISESEQAYAYASTLGEALTTMKIGDLADQEITILGEDHTYDALKIANHLLAGKMGPLYGNMTVAEYIIMDTFTVTQITDPVEREAAEDEWEAKTHMMLSNVILLLVPDRYGVSVSLYPEGYGNMNKRWPLTIRPIPATPPELPDKLPMTRVNATATFLVMGYKVLPTSYVDDYVSPIEATDLEETIGVGVWLAYCNTGKTYQLAHASYSSLPCDEDSDCTLSGQTCIDNTCQPAGVEYAVPCDKIRDSAYKSELFSALLRVSVWN